MSVTVTLNSDGKNGSALFTKCGNYRYLLTRRLLSTSDRNKSCLFIMLNPSTATADEDDPTIRRCIDFASRWRMAELRVVNLFALRATDPARLRSHIRPIGPDNDRVIAAEAKKADLIVEAWGNHGAIAGRADEVRVVLSQHRSKTRHLGMNLTGQPRHPLYVPSKTRLSPAATRSSI